MSDAIYHELSKMLDTLPNGFPSTKSGVEIKILKKIFTEEEAGLVMKLRVRMESVEQIAERTGLNAGYLKVKLNEMNRKGQLFGFAFGNTSYYRLMPYAFGIFEFQLNHMDREFAELSEQYGLEAFEMDFFSHTPALMKVIPIDAELPLESMVEPYESAAALIEGAKSWAVQECVCKKEKALTGHRCDKPIEVCIALAPVPHVFDDGRTGRPLTKEEAYGILKLSEEAGLVHMTSNYRSGHFYICNCCECCCGPLRGYKLASKNAVAKSNYIARVDADACKGCGTCADRCQAGAIAVNDCAEISKDCIGCGLCVSTCPAGAISMHRKDAADRPSVPQGELEWMEERAKNRGIGEEYKKYL